MKNQIRHKIESASHTPKDDICILMYIYVRKNEKNENLLKKSTKPLQNHYGVTKLEMNLP